MKHFLRTFLLFLVVVLGVLYAFVHQRRSLDPVERNPVSNGAGTDSRTETGAQRILLPKK
jgi:hypothetical protein